MHRIATFALATLLLAACDDRSGTSPAADPDQASADSPVGEQTQSPAPSAAGDERTSSTAAASSGQGDTAAAGQAARPGAAGDSTAAAEPPGKTRGSESKNATYGAWLQSGGRYTAGKTGVVQAVLVAKGDYKCNEKYPYKFKLDPPGAGVSYPQTTVRGIQYGKARSVLSVPFVPSKAGKATISGTFRVSVCNATTCKMGKEKLSVTVTVHDAE